MLNDNIRNYRKKKGMTQEELKKVIRTIAIIFGIIVLLWLILVIAGIGVYSIADGHTFSTAISMDEENAVYSEEEVNDAIAIVRKYFRKNFKGCKLIELNYNEEDSKEAFDEWAKQYNAEEAIILTSVFITNSKGGDGSLEPNSTYDNWQWILTKSGEENWTLQTWGY